MPLSATARATFPRFRDALERRAPFLGFLFAYLLFAALTRSQWGMTYDEPDVYLRGADLGDALSGRSDYLFHRGLEASDGNVLYCHLYAWAQSLLNPALNIVQAHWLNLLFAVPLFAAAYEGLLFSGASPLLALSGPVFLFLSPRLLGNLPINPKDGPFAVWYLLCLVVLAGPPIRQRLARVLLWGGLIGIACCLRPLGATLLLLYPLESFFRNRPDPDPKPGLFPRLARIALETSAVALAALIPLLVFWPYLRVPSHGPWLLETWSHFPHGGEQVFFGREVSDSRLPGFYFPAWVLLATPLALLAWAGAGWLWVRRNLSLWRVLWTALAVNLALLMWKRPFFYDTVRHFLYLLPPIALLAAFSFAEAWRRFASRRAVLLALACLGLLPPAVEMVRLHPYEYLYLSEWSGGFAASPGRFPGDYWSASAAEGFSWLRAHLLTDSSRAYRIHVDGFTAVGTTYYLPSNSKWTFRLEDSDYHVANRPLNPVPPGARLIHLVEREKVPLLWIYQLR